jgi:hypothetical protein
MAVIKEVDKLGDTFFLGHWGDVLFDDMGVEDGLNQEEITKVVLKKIIKKRRFGTGRIIMGKLGT